MKIVRNYYDIMLQEVEMIQSEIDLENALRSKEEQKKQEDQLSKEAEQIIQRANKRKQHTWHIHEQEKVDAFHILYGQALLFAHKNAINIKVETTCTTGRITLATPFLYDGFLPSVSNKPTLLKLITYADSFMMNAKDDMMEFDFYYNFTRKIKSPVE